jgi:excisionase family DNA binding protein
MENHNMLTAEETAKRLRISRSALSRLVCENRIGHFRIGHRVMFDQQMLDEFKASVLQPAASQKQGHGDAKGRAQ